jgi:hypothetical protein
MAFLRRQRRFHDRLKTIVGGGNLSGAQDPLLDCPINYPKHRSVSSILFLNNL